MPDLLWLIPALPFAGFLFLALAGGRLRAAAAAAMGAGSVGLSAVLAFIAAGRFLGSPPADGAWIVKLWTWWDAGGLRPDVALRLDPLSLVFVLVVTGVGFLIHLYSVEYMRGDEGFNRFFAYMNLFVGSMLTLVLADNLLLLYLGWEGVGLCSYLLIGFWYTDPQNGAAARKAFIVTRVGDTAMAVGLFLLFWNLGTLQIEELLERARVDWPAGAPLATAAALLLLGGAAGKSAQLPLQTWLPDAMAGPTPTSALIHAATMVTAGVYLIARTHVIFALAPAAMTAVAVVGALTLLLAGFSALVQSDIKRILAYSTISQIGYMFLALGVGAWSAAVFHFMTHAFFKALLFLGAGSVIIALHHEMDIWRMGGLRRSLPVTFWTFLAGAASLAALPLVTSGFYSKDLILWEAWRSGRGSPLLWAAGLLGAAVTAIYTFRLVFVVFFGEERTRVSRRPGAAMLVPLVVLAALSTAGGFVETPATLGGFDAFSRFLGGVFGEAGRAAFPEADAPDAHGHAQELLLQIVAALVSLGGVLGAYVIYLRRPQLAAAWRESSLGGALHRCWRGGWGFDRLYDLLLVRPFCWVARVNRSDLFDAGYAGLAGFALYLHGTLARTQTGRLRINAMTIVAGAIVTLALTVLR